MLYFRNKVLNVNDATSFDDLGGFNITMTVLLLISWIILFLCLLKGVETSGKVTILLEIAKLKLLMRPRQ